MALINPQEVLWIDIHGTMDLFILVIEQYLSYFSLKHSQIGHSQRHHFEYSIGLDSNKSLVDSMLQSVMLYSWLERHWAPK